ncbi:uncharacterized protein PG986_004018 [Apiospora aurea]|uniref:Uncharacterized protein n=1 Tax=Apiospora aurea TaxID=335848 RepID=A0ABR1QLD7_9PEZI
MTQSHASPNATTVVLAAAVLFSGSAQAYQGWPGSNTLVDGDAVRFSQETWRQHLRHPDARGEYPVRGFDIAQQWPDVREVGGWRLAVNVSNSIPASEVQNNGAGTVVTGNSSPPTNSSASAFKGTSISLKGPEDVIHSILGDNNGDEQDAMVALGLRSTTWKVCVTIATDDNDGNKKNGTNSNSGSVSCDRLTPQCVADFEQAYADHFAATEDCAGHPPPTPASCGGALDAASLRTIRNLTTAWWHNDDAASRMWPVLVVWGWNHRATMDDDDAAAAMRNKKPLAQLACIKATTSNARPRPAPTPTATPTVPDSSGVESSTPMLTGLALLTVAISFVLFC